MDYTEIINDFIDGRLDTGQEEELFLALASNEELRNDFRDSYMLESAFGSDFNSLRPPTKSTVNVFSKIGIPLPAPIGTPNGAAGEGDGDPGGTAAAAGGSSAGTFLGKFGHVAITGLITALTAVTVYFAFLQPDNVNSDPVINDNLSEKILTGGGVPFVSTNEGRGFEEVGGEALTGRPLHKNVVIRYVKDTIYMDKREMENPPITLNNENNSKEIEKVENDWELILSDNVMEQEPVMQKQISLYNNFNPVHSFTVDDNIKTPEIDKRWSLEVHGTQDYPLNGSPVMGYSTNPVFRNSGVGLYYKVSDNVMIGGDMRQEYFYQKYSGTMPDGKYEYFQYPNYLTVSLSGRWYFFETRFFDFVDMDLFGQAMLGFDGKLVGLIPRGLVGADVYWTPDFKFTVGLEAANMSYKHNGTNFNSPKWGINYGIGFNF